MTESDNLVIAIVCMIQVQWEVQEIVRSALPYRWSGQIHSTVVQHPCQLIPWLLHIHPWRREKVSIKSSCNGCIWKGFRLIIFSIFTIYKTILMANKSGLYLESFWKTIWPFGTKNWWSFFSTPVSLSSGLCSGTRLYFNQDQFHIDSVLSNVCCWYLFLVNGFWINWSNQWNEYLAHILMSLV